MPVIGQASPQNSLPVRTVMPKQFSGDVKLTSTACQSFVPLAKADVIAISLSSFALMISNLGRPGC